MCHKFLSLYLIEFEIIIVLNELLYIWFVDLYLFFSWVRLLQAVKLLLFTHIPFMQGNQQSGQFYVYIFIWNGEIFLSKYINECACMIFLNFIFSELKEIYEVPDIPSILVITKDSKSYNKQLVHRRNT